MSLGLEFLDGFIDTFVYRRNELLGIVLVPSGMVATSVDPSPGKLQLASDAVNVRDNKLKDRENGKTSWLTQTWDRSA